MGPVGIREILIIVLIIVVLFGAKKIPELAKGMGQGIKEFKTGMREGIDDSNSSSEEEEKKINP